jgi:hypothetical protein
MKHMSLAKPPSTSIQPSVAPPPLQHGHRLTRAEFERRYDATPGLKKAELIEGRVYIPPPISYRGHSTPHALLIGWLFTYSLAMSGVVVGDNGSLRLDLDNMPQPDAFLLIEPERGGQAKISEDDYVVGAPNWLVKSPPVVSATIFTTS